MPDTQLDTLLADPLFHAINTGIVEIQKDSGVIREITFPIGANEPTHYKGIYCHTSERVPKSMAFIGYTLGSIAITYGVDRDLEAIGLQKFGRDLRRTKASDLFGKWHASVDVQVMGAFGWRGWLELEAACRVAVQCAAQVFRASTPYNLYEHRLFSVYGQGAVAKGRQANIEVAAKFTVTRRWYEADGIKGEDGRPWPLRLMAMPELGCGFYLHETIRKQTAL